MTGDNLLGLIPLALIIGAVVWWVRSRAKPQASDLPPAQALPAGAASAAAPGAGSFGAAFESFCWVVTLLAACIAAFDLLNLAISTSLSAPQYAAMASGACAKVIVPYVFSRAVQGWRRA